MYKENISIIERIKNMYYSFVVSISNVIMKYGQKYDENAGSNSRAIPYLVIDEIIQRKQPKNKESDKLEERSLDEPKE